jgi:hypothetical protein
MPRPVYIICSESGAEDVRTGIVSHFQVVEKIQVTLLPLETGGLPVSQVISLRMTAVWMKSPDDIFDQEYELETAFYLPPDDTMRVVQTGRFSFGPDAPLFRSVAFGPCPTFVASGLFRVESRIRRVGDQEWLRQDYPILVEILPNPPLAPQAADNGQIADGTAANQ